MQKMVVLVFKSVLVTKLVLQRPLRCLKYILDTKNIMCLKILFFSSSMDFAMSMGFADHDDARKLFNDAVENDQDEIVAK